MPIFDMSGIMTPGVFGPIIFAPLTSAVSIASDRVSYWYMFRYCDYQFYSVVYCFFSCRKEEWCRYNLPIDLDVNILGMPRRHESKTGMPSKIFPPFPGVTPATNLDHHAFISLVWVDPTLLVIPWINTGFFPKPLLEELPINKSNISYSSNIVIFDSPVLV